MKKLTIAALFAAQTLTAAQPVMAAGMVEAPDRQVGAFAGFRLRVPLDGDARKRPIRAGLAVAPMLRTGNRDGEVRTRFGEGLELGIAGENPARLSLAGTPVSQIGQGQAGSRDRRLGVSTLGWVAIGVGALVVVVVAAGAICLNDSDCLPDDD
jgi:hypothetical protein